MDLDYIPEVSSYDSLQDMQLPKFQEKKARDLKEVVPIDTSENLVEEEIQINMTDRDSRSLTETLFVSYLSLLRRHGLVRLRDDNEKVVVYHVLFAILPESKHALLNCNWSFCISICARNSRDLWHMPSNFMKLSSWWTTAPLPGRENCKTSMVLVAVTTQMMTS